MSASDSEESPQAGEADPGDGEGGRPLSRRERRRERKRRRAESKMRAKIERERARAERREAIERRRAERRGVRGAADPAEAQPPSERETDEREALAQLGYLDDPDAEAEEALELDEPAVEGAMEPEPPERDTDDEDAGELETLAQLERTQSRIDGSRQRAEEALVEAQRRLERIEAQTGEAEQRAAQAERLADLKQSEQERDRRLKDMLERIDAAEMRAREAEARAREAEARARRALDELIMPDEPRPAAAQEAIEPEPEGEEDAPLGGQRRDSDPTGPVSLSEASFEELREVGLSVTQTGRVLAHRESAGGFDSVDQLGSIPGFPHEFVDSIRHRLRP